MQMYSRASSDDESVDRLDTLRRSAEFRGPMEPLGGHDHPDNHLALLYENQDEQFAATVPFIRDGLERGEWCMYIVAENDRQAVVDALREGGVDVDAALDSGALSIYTAKRSYQRDGSVEADDMIDFLESEIADVAEAYDGVRLTGEMSWVLDDGPETGELIEYEGRVNRLFAEMDGVGLCQYNRSLFPATVIRDIIRTHPHLVFDETVCQNPYYTPPEELLGPDQPANQVERMLGTLRERTETKDKLVAQHEYQRRLYEIAADADQSFEEKLQAVFELGCERFEMDLGGIARIDPEADRFRVEAVSDDHDHLTPGTQYPLSETCCRITTETDTPRAVTDTGSAGFEDTLCHDLFGVNAYLGTRLQFENANDRTFWFVSTGEREKGFSDAEKTFHHLMGQWVQYELQHQYDTDRLAAVDHLNDVARDVGRTVVQQSTREEIEQVVCERLAASDSYAFAWIGTVEDGEVQPSTSVDTQGYLDDITITADESPTGRGPTGRALRTGEPQVVQCITDDPGFGPWRKRAQERGVVATAAIPIVYEDERYGVLNVYTGRERAFGGEERAVITQLGEIVGLAIAAVEHRHELERERERMEFFNRLIRHNLLNSLNVVRARAGVLDGHVGPEMTEHLETLRSRTNDMVDLIEALRSLMRAVVDEDDHELEPISPVGVLHDEIQRARQAFDEAVFHLQGDVQDATPVLADELLEEVFENLLVNAVRHNNADTPCVVVDVEDGAGTTTVHVSDNGPGIDPEMEDRIFRKGEKGFDSPGTGFGLHLVWEIVNAYDGEISVGESDLGGARFSISLPHAETAEE